MIEITHKQAQHLIRQGMDRRLPDEQWAALQAHLERCPDCTAYRERLNFSERRMSHALHLRWGSARGPVRPVAEELLQRRRRQAKLRRFMGKAVWFVLAAVLLFGYIGYRRLTAPEPVPTLSAARRATSTPRPDETLQPKIIFRGLAAFESRNDGNAEIYLLNASGGRADLTNLIQNPANETDPAWSPDGEWIAFLSDRSGKKELYVMTVAGSRLTQLTAAPDVYWSGPLDWSADGSRIALVGQRGPGGAAFLYLAMLDGSAPRSIASTRGAQPWTRFSSSVPALAYVQDGLRVVNVETGWSSWLSFQDSLDFKYQVAQNGSFDWSLGGRSLVYVADSAVDGAGQGEAGSMLRLSPELEAGGNEEFLGRNADTIDRLPRAGAFRAVSWVPNSLQVAALQDGDNDGCWVLRINHAFNRQVTPRDIPGLCVDGGLEHTNWTPDGNWLVLVGHTPEDSAPALYAVRLLESQDADPRTPQPANLIERLADVDAPADTPAAETTAPAGPPVRVRPSGRSLRIAPQPAAALSVPQPTSAPAVLPQAGAPGLPEWMYFTVRRADGQQIFRAHPDGSQPEPLTPEGKQASCPRVGPNGEVSYVLAGESRVNAIYVTDAAGKNPRKLEYLSSFSSLEVPFSFYHCPTWSPDGRFLTFYIVYPSAPYLVILPVDGETPPTYVGIENWGRSAPVWLPEAAGEPARRILLVYPQSSQPARLVELDLSKLPQGQPVVEDPGDALTTRLVLTGWQDAWGLSLSPDGAHLAALLVYYNASSTQTGMTFGQLRVYDTERLSTLGAVPLTNFDPNTAGQGGLGWADNNTAGLVRTTSRVGSEKTIFERFDWKTNDIDTITRFEDMVTSTAWNEQGWVIFTAESGLWAMQIHNETPVPAQLTAEVVNEVEWR